MNKATLNNVALKRESVRGLRKDAYKSMFKLGDSAAKEIDKILNKKEYKIEE